MAKLALFLLGVLVGVAGLWLLAEAVGSGAGHQFRAQWAARAAKRRAWERGVYAIAR